MSPLVDLSMSTVRVDATGFRGYNELVEPG